MAAISVLYPTLGDLAKTRSPGLENALPIINLLDKRHGIHANLPQLEANGVLSHRASVVTGLPTSSVRLINQGVASTTGSHEQIQFDLCLIKTVAEIDNEYLKIAGDKGAEIGKRLMLHFESARQKWSSLAWYGVYSDGMAGLSSLYSDPTATNGRNVIDAGGTDASDNASIWLFNAGPGVSIRYPRGSAAGIIRDGGGYVWSESLGGTAGNKGVVYREEVGIAGAPVVEDWRDVVRVGSIDMSALAAQTNDADLLSLSGDALSCLDGQQTHRRFFVMNARVWRYLQKQRDAKNVAGGGVTMQNVDGFEGLMPMLHNIPVVIDDNLLNTEAAV